MLACWSTDPHDVREALYADPDLHATLRTDNNQVTIRATTTASSPSSTPTPDGRRLTKRSHRP